MTNEVNRKLDTLVVDDEALIRSSLRRTLGKYNIIEAKSGNDAIGQLQDGTLDPDAIISDLLMPNGTGKDLFEWLQANRPELAKKIIFMTGNPGLLQTFSDSIQQGRLIDKPFDVPVLRAAVEKVLSSAEEEEVQEEDGAADATQEGDPSRTPTQENPAVTPGQPLPRIRHKK